MRVNKCLNSKISCTLDRVELIRKELIERIKELVDEYEIVVYQQTLSCGIDSTYDEIRSIEYDDEGNIVILDENDYKVSNVKDLSVDELQYILLRID